MKLHDGSIIRYILTEGDRDAAAAVGGIGVGGAEAFGCFFLFLVHFIFCQEGVES